MSAQSFLEPRASTRLDDYVVDIAWSPDGRQLAIAGGEGKVVLAEFADGSLATRTVGEHGMGTLAVAWQPQAAGAGSRLFASSGQDSALNLWNAATGELQRRLRPAPAWTEHLAWAPDGKRLASAAGKAITIWDAAGETLHELPPAPSSVAALAWDKPGRDLGAAIHGGVMLHRFDAATPTSRRLKWDGAALTIAFSPNSKFLASGMQDGSVHFWYLATARDSQMRGYPGKVTQTAWSSNSRYLATGAGPSVVVWDFGGKGPEGTRPIELRGHTDRVEALAFQPGGVHLVSGGRDWRISLWAPGKATVAVDAHLAEAEVTAIRWSQDGRFVAVGERQGALTVFELVQSAR